MFNTAPIMEWHNTTLLCCFRDFWHIDEKCKSFDCKDLKTGAVYRDFMDNLLIFVCVFYVAMKHCIRWDFRLKFMDFWTSSDFWWKFLIIKKVINTMLITQNNMWITFCLKTYLKTKFPTRHTKLNKNQHIFPTCNPK